MHEDLFVHDIRDDLIGPKSVIVIVLKNQPRKKPAAAHQDARDHGFGKILGRNSGRD